MILRIAITFIGAFFLSLILTLVSHMLFVFGKAPTSQLFGDILRMQGFWIAVVVWTILFFLLFTLPSTLLFTRKKKVS